MAGNKIVDLLWHLPYNIIDRTYSLPWFMQKAGKLLPSKSKFWNILNQKNKETTLQSHCHRWYWYIELIFFKVYAKSIAQNLPLWWKNNFWKNWTFQRQNQMTHPDYILPVSQFSQINGFEPVYALTAGISNKFANKICNESILRCPKMPEWLEENHQKQCIFRVSIRHLLALTIQNL